MKTTFSKLKINDHFFDPLSGDFFIKSSDNTGTFDSGGDYLENQIVEFKENDEVLTSEPTA